MNAQKAKMKGNEGSKGQKFENVAAPGVVKAFMWDMKEMSHFWQLVRGGPRGSPDKPK